MRTVTQEVNQTPVLIIDPQNPEPERIEQAVAVLSMGGMVIVPTDTVYGIGLACTAAATPKTLALAKQRPEEKNIPLLVASKDDLLRYGRAVPSYAHELALQHWPGALTLVVKASDAIPAQFVAPDGSIALRMPAHPLTLALLEALNAPLACSSANLAGRQPALSCAEVDAALAENVTFIIDGGAVTGGAASTVISCLEDEPHVLREGPITL